MLIPIPVFGRQVPVQAWNYPVWIASSILEGMLAATYVRHARDEVDATRVDDAADAPSRFGMVGGVLAWFAVGCPVCSKLALLTTAGALVVRLRGQILCRTPEVRSAQQLTTPSTGRAR